MKVESKPLTELEQKLSDISTQIYTAGRNEDTQEAVDLMYELWDLIPGWKKLTHDCRPGPEENFVLRPIWNPSNLKFASTYKDNDFGKTYFSMDYASCDWEIFIRAGWEFIVLPK